MQYVKYLIAFTSILLLLTCNRDKNINDLKFDLNGLCVLTDWYMVGPFKYDTLKHEVWQTFANRYLDYYSINEDSFKIRVLEILKKSTQ